MGKKVRILMIDDEKDFLEPMAFWLESKGYSTRVVTSGAEGIKEIEKDPPDVVFLDIFMPEMNGVQTLTGIREINKEVPVIMLTAAEVKNIEDAYTIEELNKLGLSGFFKKKDSFEELTRLLDVTLRLHKNIKDSASDSEEE